MKKLIGIILTLCLVLSLTVSALAASKPEITKQPETATTSKKGAVSFSVTVKGTVSSYTWYFVNPETGDKVSGKKLSSVVKGVKVSNPNSKKISLSRVPDSMHGWSPDELHRAYPPGKPKIAFGPGIKQMIQDGTYDRAELERMVKEAGLEVFDPDSDKNLS